jgi:hypothetical protein
MAGTQNMSQYNISNVREYIILTLELSLMISEKI